MGKVIAGEQCKGFKYAYADKWYIHKPESVLENEMHKILWDFEIWIIIIMSCRRHGYPWPSLTTFPYRSSPPAGLQSHTLYPHIAAGCMFVLVVLLFARPYVGVHWSTSLMSSSLLLQQWLACLVCLTWIVFMMGGRWPYSWCLVGCCHLDLFNIARQHSCVIAV